MFRQIALAVAAFSGLSTIASAAEPVTLSENTYKPGMGVLIIHVNWGRTWKCGNYENAQIEALTFSRIPLDAQSAITLDIVTPSKLSAPNRFQPLVYVIQPGEYAITGFDVKVARSISDIGHFVGNRDNLVKDGKALGGTFTVGADEVVYIGHFGLDCGEEPFLWRTYIDRRNEFEKYAADFRAAFPVVSNLPVSHRLFSTKLFGQPFVLEPSVVK